jgi:hypothetical protein
MNRIDEGRPFACFVLRMIVGWLDLVCSYPQTKNEFMNEDLW